ncbi:LacI family DNA-binding transcriptional regulator [Streptomyces tremellae]|uniref:LacI family DNA-binding transcriptional regulator n=1 Tax=Streptomyces tremellae TaxID=1124239 RepID=A0ABP7FSW3_9ACTN
MAQSPPPARPGQEGAATPRRRPTLRDVAEAAGVAAKTVSRVVNGEAGVGAATTERVRRVIAELGYRPNSSARTLRQGRAATIGLVCDDVSEPFQSALTRAVEEVAIRHECMLLVASSLHDRERERTSVQALLARQVDGLIVTPVAGSQAYLGADIAAGTPVVFADRPAVGAEADTVLVDNVEGARRGVRHLLEQGHRRIGFVGDAPHLYTQDERVEGYRAALRDAGVPEDDRLISRQVPESGAVRATVESMLSAPEPATALFTGNALCTYAVLRALRDAGPPPALVAFDDFPLAELLHPAVTVVAQDPVGMGRTAAEILFRRIAGDTSADQVVRLRTRLIPRGSGERAPAEG